MRNIYFQMVHSLKCIFKDTKPLISKLLTFAIVILILGSAFSESFDATSMEPVQIAVLNQDQGPVGGMIVAWLEGNDNAFDMPQGEPAAPSPEATEENEATQWLTAVTVSSFEEGQKLAEEKNEKKRVSALIVIPADFSAKIDARENTKIEIYCGRASIVGATVVECVFDTFVTSFNYRTALENMGQQVINELNTEESIKQMDMGDVDSPDAMGYYAIAMLMMVLLYSAEYGVNGIADDYLGVIGERIRTTPIKAYQQYTGKLIGMCIASTLQGFFIVLLSGLAYGANWGNDWLMLFAVIFSMSFVATAFGAMFCMITRDGQKAANFVTILVIGCTLLAGGFVKVDMGFAKYISPNYYAQTALFNSIYGGDMSIAYSYVGVLWIFGIAASAVALLLSRRKRA